MTALTTDPSQNVLAQAVEVLKIEAQGILGLIDRIDSRFAEMVSLVGKVRGRLIVSGIGKSGIVGRKIVATLNSTGTRALFLHPVEAMHGDLGLVSRDDILLALSNSGETEELNRLIPSIRAMGCPIIAFTGDTDSTLARLSDIVIDVRVEKEACPMGLAPTASTTALLAVGDALAVVLSNKHHFNSRDFKRFHPGGNLGQRLSSRVADLMLTAGAVPVVQKSAPLHQAIGIMDRRNLGVTLVADEQRHLTGIITDGDLRRLLVRGKAVEDLLAADVMTSAPRRVGPQTFTYDALNLMETFQITVLPVVDANGGIVGILHLHDILGKGEFKFNGNLHKEKPHDPTCG